MKIAISADHRGTNLFDSLSAVARELGHELIPVPTCQSTTCDYPDMAYGACRAVADGQADRAILICGSGVGMCMAANKIKGIRAALAHDDLTAEMSRRHNDANVLCLPADLIGQKLAEKVVSIWLQTEFEGGRHARRVQKIMALERGEDPAQVTA